MNKDKKETVDLTVEERLKALYQLQSLLSEIDQIKTLRGELPLEVQDLEDEIEGLQTRMLKLTHDIEELRVAINEKRGDINESESLIDRYKQQLENVRNNREYDTLSKEIEFQTLEIELANKRIREGNTQIGLKNEELVNSRTLLDERREDLEAKRGELDEIIAETKMEEEKLREKARALEVTIEPRLLAAFKRIRKASRNGLGVVYVTRDACGGCFNKIPPQKQLDIRMRKKIIVCEYCGRIMVDPELAGVQPNAQAAAEEKPARKKRALRRKTEE
ncbi:MAG: hypothetical protein HUJ99_00885 [Bacteroidaceae bacterium]|nr:hypothetical protein [Bacteroidaceae bacterium]